MLSINGQHNNKWKKAKKKTHRRRFVVTQNSTTTTTNNKWNIRQPTKRYRHYVFAITYSRRKCVWKKKREQNNKILEEKLWFFGWFYAPYKSQCKKLIRIFLSFALSLFCVLFFSFFLRFSFLLNSNIKSNVNCEMPYNGDRQHNKLIHVYLCILLFPLCVCRYKIHLYRVYKYKTRKKKEKFSKSN